VIARPGPAFLFFVCLSSESKPDIYSELGFGQGLLHIVQDQLPFDELVCMHEATTG
jgi:hypothetical protein